MRTAAVGRFDSAGSHEQSGSWTTSACQPSDIRYSSMVPAQPGHEGICRAALYSEAGGSTIERTMTFTLCSSGSVGV